FDAGTAVVTGDTTAALNDNAASDVSPTCSPTAISSGKDVVYSYTLAASQDVTVNVAPSAGTFNPVLYVRKPGSCSNAACTEELGCAAGGASGPRQLRFPSQDAGTYFVWVDGALNTAGQFTLTATTAAPSAPPANDDCAGAATLTFNTGQV